jgi:hypothetical protein
MNRKAPVIVAAGCAVAASLLVPGCTSEKQAASTSTTVMSESMSFDAERVGAVPAGWRVEGTRQGDGPLATWAVTNDASAPSPPNVLALVTSEHGQDHTFNLCRTDETRFRDGRISVKFKAVSGEVDRGGGPIWRAHDADNYYICRANPLEHNFRVYKVVDGTRKQLATVSVDVPSGVWHTIEVEHIGNRIVCTLDGAARIEAADDALPEVGGVGLWTKADAVTSFDDLTVTPADE